MITDLGDKPGEIPADAAPRVANELNELLRQPFYTRKAMEVSQHLKQEDGPGRAADLIEEILSGKPNGSEELAYASRR